SFHCYCCCVYLLSFPTRRSSDLLASFLRPGGILILEAFSKKHIQNQQLNPSAGGPRDPEMLYDLEELQKDFKDFDFIEAVEESTILSEGKNHLGKAEVIRIYATKN